MVPLLISDPDTIKIEPNNLANFTAVTFLEGPSGLTPDENQNYNPTLKFVFNTQDSADNEATLVIKYNRPVHTVYRGIISFTTPVFKENDSLKVNVFGQTVIDESISSTVAAGGPYKK